MDGNASSLIQSPTIKIHYFAIANDISKSTTTPPTILFTRQPTNLDLATKNDNDESLEASPSSSMYDEQIPSHPDLDDRRLIDNITI
jgi:hypothetical protein